jgi:uncharacterized protein YcsI (UPF0317 family)
MDVAPDLTRALPADARQLMREGRFTRPTTGVCLGYLQANMAILPRAEAEDFRRYCQANPQPMPLVDVTEPGDPTPRRVAPSADLRTDLPRYRVWRRGEVVDEPTSIEDLWTEEMVAFLLGCSFSAENRLLDAGVRLRHMELGGNVPMFVTSIQCTPAGRFHGPMVVSMRPIARAQAELTRRVTAELPLAHGAPIQIDEPGAIGIADLARPDFGDTILPEPDEVPVFWACGVTPQAAIMTVKPELAITHAPGHMFITDVPEGQIVGKQTAAIG